VTLFEGHNQQIRKMFDAIGHSVVKLRRIAIGNVSEDKMPIGSYRELGADEIKQLLKPRKKTEPKSKSEKPNAQPAEHSRALKPKKPSRKRGIARTSSGASRSSRNKSS
jgi:hypothetical protein